MNKGQIPMQYIVRYLIGKVWDVNDGVGGAGGGACQPASQEEVAEVGGAGGQHQFVSLHCTTV